MAGLWRPNSAIKRHLLFLVMAKLVTNFVHIVEILVFDVIPREGAM
jgi:hypothetical protein